MAGTANFTIYQGDTFKKTLTWKAAGQPVDITGFKFEFRASASGGGGNITITTDNGGITVDDPLKGEFTITISREQTASYSWGSANYLLRAIYPNSETKRLLEGKLKLDRGV